ncbi:MFS transporter [bacterium]|nr:MFS transporter [bacterium]
MSGILQSIRQGPPWLPRLLVAVAAFNLSFGILWVAYNLYLKALGYGEELAGYATAASSIAALIFALPIGKLTDKWGAGPVLLVGLYLMSVGILLRGVAMVPLTVLATAFFSGALFEPLRHVVDPLLALGEEKSANRRFAFTFALGSTFTALGTWLGGHLPEILSPHTSWLPGGLEVGGYQATFLLAGLVLPLAAWIASPLMDVHHGQGARSQKENRLGLRQLLSRDNWAVGKYWLTMLPIGLGAGLSVPFMNLYLRNIHNLTDASVGNAFSIQQIVLVFAFFLGPWIANKIRATRGIVLLEVLSLPFLVTLAFTTSPLWAVVAFIARGALMNASMPLGTRLLMTLSPPGSRGLSSAVVGMIWGLGFAVGPALGGGWIEKSGYVGPFLLTASLYLISLILFCLFFWNLKMAEESELPSPSETIR